nr:EamA family transporter [uncultured Undibacterium sp.]
MSQNGLTPSQIGIAMIVIILWGLNFVVIKVGLQGIPPFLLATLRFVFVAFPAIFFLARPQVPIKLLIAYALTISLGQFAFLFSAIAVGMPAGLASLVLQAQAFFTIGISAFVFGDKLRFSNVCGMIVASIGLFLLGSAGIQANPLHFSIAGFVLTLCAALSWACGNVINKKMGSVGVLNLVAWSALVPILPFFALAICFEGASTVWDSLVHIQIKSIAAILYLAGAASLIGYTLWGKLLGGLPTHLVAPLSLLVPVVGLSSAWILLDEVLSQMQMIGALIVMVGLLINVFGARFMQAIKALQGARAR